MSNNPWVRVTRNTYDSQVFRCRRMAPACHRGCDLHGCVRGCVHGCGCDRGGCGYDRDRAVAPRLASSGAAAAPASESYCGGGVSLLLKTKTIHSTYLSTYHLPSFVVRVCADYPL